jgi:hypothetical protein
MRPDLSLPSRKYKLPDLCKFKTPEPSSLLQYEIFHILFINGTQKEKYKNFRKQDFC